jgi:hypothetical protein
MVEDTVTAVRPEGTEKWVAYNRLDRGIVEDVELRDSILDAGCVDLAASQGVTLVEKIGISLAPHRWEHDEEGHPVPVACPDENADHYLVAVKWRAR